MPESSATARDLDPKAVDRVLRRIRQWRDDDRQGYDVAIGLLCDGEEAITDLLAEVGRLRSRLRALEEALIQARGALRLDAMVDDKGEPYGTTVEALRAITEALAGAPAQDTEPH